MYVTKSAAPIETFNSTQYSFGKLKIKTWFTVVKEWAEKEYQPSPYLNIHIHIQKEIL
jgi:hypothetical protein